MNPPLPHCPVNLSERLSTFGPMRRGRRNAAWRRREYGRTEAGTGKNLERHRLGFLGLQPLEIPQNGQRNLWKSLDENTLVLEKLGELQGGPPLFRHVRSSPRAGLEGVLGHMHCPSGDP
jgi:hypothetical protein